MKALFVWDLVTFYSHCWYTVFQILMAFLFWFFTSAVERCKQRDNNHFCRNHIIKLHQFKGNCVAVYIDSSSTAEDNQTFYRHLLFFHRFLNMLGPKKILKYLQSLWTGFLIPSRGLDSSKYCTLYYFTFVHSRL